MSESSTNDAITLLLERARSGDEEAAEQLYRQTYQRLRRLASAQRSQHARPSSDLNTTALVHEAYLKFERAGSLEFADREHFYSVAARAMRQLLVDRARRNLRAKRGGGAPEADSDQLERLAVDPQLAGSSERLLDFDRALEELGPDTRIVRVVECRVFSGMNEREIADVLGVDPRTVRRDWAKARAFLALTLLPKAD